MRPRRFPTPSTSGRTCVYRHLDRPEAGTCKNPMCGKGRDG